MIGTSTDSLETSPFSFPLGKSSDLFSFSKQHILKDDRYQAKNDFHKCFFVTTPLPLPKSRNLDNNFKFQLIKRRPTSST